VLVVRVEIWAKKKGDTGGGDYGWSVRGVRVRDKRLKESTFFFLTLAKLVKSVRFYRV
jgi:hypothetical protein